MHAPQETWQDMPGDTVNLGTGVTTVGSGNRKRGYGQVRAGVERLRNTVPTSRRAAEEGGRDTELLF